MREQYLQSIAEHKHANEETAGRNVSETVSTVKRRAQKADDNQLPIIRNEVVAIPHASQPAMPSTNALRANVKPSLQNG